MSKKKKEKKEPRKIIIEVGKDDVIGEYRTPQSCQTWQSDKDMSKELVEMLEELFILVRVIAKKLNEGPEVANSVVKRTHVLKGVIHQLLMNTFLDGYHRLGILSEVSFDVYMSLGGKIKVAKILSEFQLMALTQMQGQQCKSCKMKDEDKKSKKRKTSYVA